MTKKPMKNTSKLAITAAAACAVCCAPLVVPFIAGIAGVGALGVGQWLIGGLLVIAAVLFAIRRKKKICGCSSSSECGHITTG